MDNTIAAAAAVGAIVVLPGTIYNYGPDAFPVLTEASSQHPETRKGAIRVEMEQRLREYARRGGRVLIVRCGDFFGPMAGNSWFAQGLVKPGRPVKTVYQPGDAGVGHTWSYLPDVGRAVVELLEKGSSLESFATFHMRGHWDADGTQMANAIRRVVARQDRCRAAGRPVSLVVADIGVAVCYDVRGNAGNALSVAQSAANGQRAARVGSRPGAAHRAR